jgi:hypothetical protein
MTDLLPIVFPGIGRRQGITGAGQEGRTCSIKRLPRKKGKSTFYIGVLLDTNLEYGY